MKTKTEQAIRTLENLKKYIAEDAPFTGTLKKEIDEALDKALDSLNEDNLLERDEIDSAEEDGYNYGYSQAKADLSDTIWEIKKLIDTAWEKI